jgi:hypothetical protein
MKIENDHDVEDLLARTGRALVPSQKGLRSALASYVQPGSVRSPLSIISLYMNSTSKVLVAIVALVVVGSGVYVMTGSKTEEVAQTPTMFAADTTSAQNTESARTATMAAPAPAPTAATDSFDDFSAAMKSDAAAQESAVSSTDAATDQAVASENNVTSSSEPYDPSNI